MNPVEQNDPKLKFLPIGLGSNAGVKDGLILSQQDSVQLGSARIIFARKKQSKAKHESDGQEHHELPRPKLIAI